VLLPEATAPVAPPIEIVPGNPPVLDVLVLVLFTGLALEELWEIASTEVLEDGSWEQSFFAQATLLETCDTEFSPEDGTVLAIEEIKVCGINEVGITVAKDVTFKVEDGEREQS
jgi:hypothetical protein